MTSPFRFRLRFLTSFGLLLIAALASSANSFAEQSVYIFSYFQETNGANGLHLAYSLDGYSYHALNANSGYVTDTNSFMRDPFVYACKDGVYRMVYTTGWGGGAGSTAISTIGYSESTDLIHWSTSSTITLPIADGQERWAPQIYYDTDNSQYMVYWSTRVGTTGYLKMYYSTTTDFKTYSTPQILLEAAGTHLLDGDISKVGSTYNMVLAGCYLATGGTNLYGSYSGLTKITSSAYAAEGPTTVKIGDRWVVLNDHYTTSTYGAMISDDNMQTWTEYTDGVSIPYKSRHGNVFTVSYSVAQALASGSTYKPSEDEFVGSAGTSDFNTAANWFAQSVPGASQTPIIQAGANVTMTTSPTGTFSGLKVGSTSSGTLSISNATLKITSSWPSGLILGECVQGFGSIVQNGTAAVTVNGFASLARCGTGVYTLNGGSLTITSDCNVADFVGARGTVNVNGGSLTTYSLYAGAGYNTATVSAVGTSVGVVCQTGGSVAVTGSGDLVVFGGRDSAAGVGVYEISGGTFNASNANVLVGKYGQGTLSQTGGTFGAARNLYFGRYAGSTGSGTISGGTLSQSNSSYRTYVGYAGTGSLTVTGSGLVNAAGGLTVAGASAGRGSLYLNGGTLATTFISDGGGTSALYFNGGTIKAKTSSASFLAGLDGAYVQAGGAVIDSDGNDITISQALLNASASGGLTKYGLGALTLNGSSTYTGATTVRGGVLALGNAGSLDASATIDVQKGVFDVSAKSGFAVKASQTLKGNGEVIGAVQVLGVLQPGDGVGTLVTDDVTFASGSQLKIELAGLVAATSNDILASSGKVTLQEGCQLAVTTLDDFKPTTGATFDILDFAAISGTFSTISLPTLDAGCRWNLDKLYVDGTISVVPEPATSIAMLAIGLTYVSFRIQRRRKP